jgi:hypothetical protein
MKNWVCNTRTICLYIYMHTSLVHEWLDGFCSYSVFQGFYIYEHSSFKNMGLS